MVVQQRAMPFGALAAVYGWDRVGAAITAILRSLGLPVLRYVDDLFLAVPAHVGDIARRILEEVVAQLGWHLASEKTEGPVKDMVILGVLVSVHHSHLRLQPEEQKAELWLQQLRDVLSANLLRPGEASKLAGRLSFAQQAVFGRVGRAQLRPLFRRAHSKHTCLTSELRRTVTWWVRLLQAGVCSAKFPLSDEGPSPALLYTDAVGGGRMGMALYSAEGRLLKWSALTPSKRLHATLLPRKNQVNAWETMAALWAVIQSAAALRGRPVHLYVDNTVAQGALRKGSSPKEDLNRLAGDFWLLAAELQLSVHVWRVPSKSNPADAPSRGEPPCGAGSMAPSGEDLGTTAHDNLPRIAWRDYGDLCG